MIRTKTAFLFVLAVVIQAAPAQGAEVVVVRQWEIHSSFWMSLHQRLIADAAAPNIRDLAALSPEEQAAWTASASVYRSTGGPGNITFARPMLVTTDALTQVADDAVDLAIDAPLKDPLVRAAPIYRKYWWVGDDRSNRFFIAYAAAMLREGAEALVRGHELAYAAAWPTRIRVYITPVAGPFGAYTVSGMAGGWITTMSSRDASYQGVRALEMLLHEASHAVVGPNQSVGAVIANAAKSRNVAAPPDLWHAILFATSSELTRRVLLERGIVDYVPYSVDMFARVWPNYRQPIERFWLPYLNGEGTLEQAISRLMEAIQR